jgi:hypothetical protein
MTTVSRRSRMLAPQMGGDRASVYPRCPRDAVLVPDRWMRARSAPTFRRAGLTSITECFRRRRLSEDLAACGSLLVALAPMREWRCTSLVAARCQSRWRCMRSCQGFHSDCTEAARLAASLGGRVSSLMELRCCAGASGEALYWPSPPHRSTSVLTWGTSGHAPLARAQGARLGHDALRRSLPRGHPRRSSVRR